MKSLSIGYIVDHPKRDLSGAIQFARALLDRGCNAYVIPLYEQGIDVPLLGLDAVVVNFARPANLALVAGYRAIGLPVFVMDTEGGNHTVAGSNTPQRLAELLRERGFAKLLTGHFFWGPALRDMFAEHSGMADSQLITTGCPRFDYASERWRPLLQSPERDYVLVNSNFSLINPQFSSSQDAERVAMTDTGWEAGYVDRLIEALKIAVRAFTDEVARLATDLPDTRFVYRPHPFENHDFYRARFSTFRNVVVRGEGDVLSAIAHARCVLHLNCATAVESTMLGCLPISLEYLNTPTLLNHAPLPSQISCHARDYEHALALVRDGSGDAFDFSARYREFVQPWWYLNDGGAADRMVEALLERLEPSHRSPAIAQSLRGSRCTPSLGQRLQGAAANVLGSHMLSKLRAALNPKRRGKRLEVPEVRSALERLRAVENVGAFEVTHARHPYTGLPLASMVCRKV